MLMFEKTVIDFIFQLTVARNRIVDDSKTSFMTAIC